MTPHYPAGTVRALLKTDDVTDITRQVLTDRLNATIPKPTFFTADEYSLLQGICNRLIPQEDRPQLIDMVGDTDRRLANQETNGWRYDTMPADGDAYKLGLQGIEESSQAMFQQGFKNISAAQQDSILRAVQTKTAPGETWKKLPADRFFEELLAEATENYFSNPLAQEEIGYVGMADVPTWQRIGLNELEDREPKEIRVNDK